MEKIAKIQMFKNLEIEYDGNVLKYDDIHSIKISNLFAYFASHRSSSVTVYDLEEILWEGEETKNPTGALKNLIYRFRDLLGKTFGRKDFILTGKGCYRWNNEIKVSLDCEEFESLIRQAHSEQDYSKKQELYDQALRLYKGPFLPKLGSKLWVIPYATYFHSLYIDEVKTYLQLLEEHEEYEKMVQLCLTALQFEELDETIHFYTVKSYFKTKGLDAALKHYYNATSLLYEKLGIRPSKELQAIYTDLMKQKNNTEVNIDIIQNELEEALQPQSAYFCEYGVFKEIYRLQMRSMERLGMSVYVALLTLSPDTSYNITQEHSLTLINQSMVKLQNVLKHALRISDTVTRYSGNQFMILLPTCDYESSKKVMNRILNQFFKENKFPMVRLQYTISALPLKGALT